MSLLHEIQAEATNRDADVPTLLRQCLVLAHRLESEELKLWANQELNGYPDRSTLPEYRKPRIASHGNFVGSFGRSAKNLPIPLSSLPQAWRDEYEYAYLTMPIQSYAELVRRGREIGGGSHQPWPADAVAQVATKIFVGMVLVSAWQHIPQALLEGLVDTIKTRVLNFTLTIADEAPAAGEASSDAPPLSPERVSQVFHTYIIGDVQNVAAGGAQVHQTAAVVQTPPDEVFRALLDAVQCAQASSSEIQTVKTAIEEMGESYGSEGFSEKYREFMGTLADHLQIFGPVVGPLLPGLAQLG